MEKSKGFIGEFKTFIMRGNVMDLAIAVIIGGAFQAIVSSLVADIVMPLISLLTGGLDFSAWKIMLGDGPDAASINYGVFITAIINFLLMAFVILSPLSVFLRVESVPTPVLKNRMIVKLQLFANSVIRKPFLQRNII